MKRLGGRSEGMKTLSCKVNRASGLLAIFLSVLIALTFMPTIPHTGTGVEESFAENESKGYAQVALGYYHSGAVTKDGKLYMWGHNENGELGDGSTSASLSPRQIPIPGGAKVKALSLGEHHSGVITEDGKLYIWGSNYSGRLGDGTEEYRSTPQQITMLGGAKVETLSLGGSHSGAITEDGKLYMWGSNVFGQLGDGTDEDSLTPKQIAIPGGAKVKALSLGAQHSGVITENGKLYMWGAGPLGDGTYNGCLTPKEILLPGAEKVKGLSIQRFDFDQTMIGVITEDGKLYTWGSNYSGQLGDGTANDSLTPKWIDMPEGAKVETLSLGYSHSGAITEDGKLYMWGSNHLGQLGDGTDEGNLSPKHIATPGGRKAKILSLGNNRSGAMMEDGKIYMWGCGPLGDSTYYESFIPKHISLPIEDKTPISDAQIICQSPLVYTGVALQPKIAVSYSENLLKEGTDYKVSYENNVNAGTGSAIVEGLGNYTGKATTSFRIDKAANPLTVKGKTTKVKYSKLKKKSQTIKSSKAITVSGAQGKVTYKKVSVGSKKINKKYGKKIKIDSKTGKVTVKKGLKKGTYKVKVKVKATGNVNYKPSTDKTVTFKIAIK